MATAQQTWAMNDLKLKQQQKALEKAYARQLEDTQDAYELAGSQSERNMLSKGMQRSSYGAATLGNINIKGAEAKADILENRTDALGNLAEQRALLKAQLSASLASAREAAGLNRSSTTPTDPDARRPGETWEEWMKRMGVNLTPAQPNTSGSMAYVPNPTVPRYTQ